LQDQRDRALHGVACHLLVVDLEYDGADVEDKCVGAAARFMIMAVSVGVTSTG
jgi:hypothetical protein